MVNILSQCAHCGQSYLAPYSGSKGALATLTKNVANAYRHNRIRCNAILPGWMDTPGEDATQRRWHGATDGWLERAEAGQPMGQLCKPYQLAGLASYLLSPEAGVMTGALVDYDQNIPGALSRVRTLGSVGPGGACAITRRFSARTAEAAGVTGRRF
jgi:NAD(P)-dependent dehydrogenase (short-subunit alcohol dehydrogenase family)